MLWVLVVEDDPTLREVLYDLLSEDFCCYAVKSVEEAQERLEAQQFDIVLTDISMPGKSGLELLGCIKQRWPELPVIMFSGIDDEEYAEGLFKIGAFDYLAKPFKVEEIAQSVARAAAQHPRLSKDPPANGDADVPELEGRVEVDNSPIFTVQLGGIISLAELLDIVQRGKMSGYIELHWDNMTVRRAKELGRFNDAAGALDAAVLNCAGWLYLNDGLIIDAVIDEAEDSAYWRDAEQSLAVLVKLATYVGGGVRAWGFSLTDMGRPAKLSVEDNSGKLFSIITSDEREADYPPNLHTPGRPEPVSESVAHG